MGPNCWGLSHLLIFSRSNRVRVSGLQTLTEPWDNGCRPELIFKFLPICGVIFLQTKQEKEYLCTFFSFRRQTARGSLAKLLIIVSSSNTKSGMSLQNACVAFRYRDCVFCPAEKIITCVSHSYLSYLQFFEKHVYNKWKKISVNNSLHLIDEWD